MTRREFHNWLLNWKPIHLCKAFRYMGWPIPKYFIGGGGSFVPEQASWWWYEDDFAEPTSALADEDTAPVITAHTDIIRLRVAIAETDGKDGVDQALTLEYSTNDTDWNSFGAAPAHFNYANGKATEGNNVTGLLVSDSDTAGEYHESGTNIDDYASATTTEADIAIVPTASVSPSTLYYFRVKLNAVEVPLNGAHIHPKVIISSVLSETEWTERQPAGDFAKDWYCGAIDDDGSVLLAGYTGGELFLSKDYGASWSDTDPPGLSGTELWWGCASDSDGSNLIACAQTGRVWISSNSGDNWTDADPVEDNSDHDWFCCASDNDGSVLMAAEVDGRLYVSIDSGANWTDVDPPGLNGDEGWRSCACSSDGAKMIAVAAPGRVWTSVNSGVDWTERQPDGAEDKAWRCCASSANGNYLLAGIAGAGGRLYLSINSGVDWAEIQPAGDSDEIWRPCAISDDGENIIVCAGTGRLWTSTDGGDNWVEERPDDVNEDKNWNFCASDADGNFLMSAVLGGRLWTAGSAPSAGGPRGPLGHPLHGLFRGPI